jgi:subtilase family serine protease
VSPTYILLPQGGGVTPFGGPGPTGTTPAQIRHAYGFDQVSFSNGTVAADGTGTTIAIVDAFDDPNIANDLHQFDVTFGLPDPTFTKVNQTGGSTPPAANGGWASEIALDVEWAHAIAPGAGILLVEANDSSFTNLLAAVSFAAKQPGVVAVSMSWGGGEFTGENSFDSTFQTPSGHGGVTFVASSGDSGAPASYPAASPNVLAVGGTTLNLDSAGNILSESGWSGSGGGLSAVEAQPPYQNGVVTQSSTQRANPDVAYDADPNTGFPVYDSFNNGSAAPWSQFGGTSDASPQWAALIAIADQGRGLANALDGPSQTLPKLYSLTSDFNDITTGSSFGSPTLSAGPGYDLVTGLGTPQANKLIPDLVGQTNPPVGATHFTVSAPAGSTAGTAFTVTVTALDSTNNPVTSYAGTVHFTSSDTQAGLPLNYTFNTGDAGVHSFSITLYSAGSQSVTVTDMANSSITGQAAVSVSPASPSKLVFGQQPTSTGTGAVISPAVTVRVLDAYGNLVTTDNTDRVSVAFGNNAGGSTLSGTTTVTVSGGVATFNNLSINNAGSGYTLSATSGVLVGATSASFNVVAGSVGNVIEGFETQQTYFVTGTGNVNAVLGTYAAHDGTWGLDMWASTDWIYRNDAGAHVKAGDTISLWLQFAGSADGRAYFGFGASASGTLSLVAAPNTGQLIIQRNLGYGFTNLAAVSASYLPNHWYRLEVDWGKTGMIIGKLFDSNGTTLLRQVTARTTSILSGGIAFRATGSDKYFDTVTDTSGVNNFALAASGSSTGLGTVLIGVPPRAPEASSQFVAALGGRMSNWATDSLFVSGPRNGHRLTGLLGTSEWGGWF